MSRSQDFLRGTAADQSRRLATTGAAAIALLGVAVVGAATVYPKITAPEGIEVAVDVSYVGPGVAEGTKVVLRGQSVGLVTSLERTESESVRMGLLFDEDQISGLTDELQLDFRPENYFGTSAVNILARPGGAPLESGMHLAREPEGDFTMSTMIEQGSLTIDGTLTDSMITSLDKSVHYLDGVTGWIDTGLLVADRVAVTQQEIPSTQIAYFNDILDAMPGFSDQAIESLMNIYDSNYNRLSDGSIGVDDAVFDEANAGLTLAANQLFGQAGALLASHGEEVTPLVTSIAVASDTFPHLVNGGMTAEAAQDIIRRLDSAFVDTPDGHRLRLRVLVDGFPAFAAPLGLGAAPEQEDDGR
ncbi:MlaD family protein [Rhodococcus artemisiae]|uniref:Mce family protein n=1 Tax=Rhodococcus artemisiae TaxID=714159 RepID=A0ABU7LJC9_9NOCA|nr:Mce family protein [Rhodococcus artemisiae]MEE2061674.1 Mce family protein [Rhodococcus artemisiae]